MFIRFSVSNCFSFDEEFECSLQASDDDRRINHVANIDNSVDVLKSGIIFGANSSGKTNLLKAIAILKHIINKAEVDSSLDNFKFLLANDSDKRPIIFEIEFSSNSNIYTYGISISKGIVEEEYLYQITLDKETMLFKREHNFSNDTISVDFKPRTIRSQQDDLIDIDHKKFTIETLEEGLLKKNELLIKYKDILSIKELDDVVDYFLNNLIVFSNDDNFPYFDKEDFIFKKNLSEDFKFKRFLDNILQHLDLGVDKCFFHSTDISKFFDAQSKIHTKSNIDTRLLTKRYIENDKIVFDLDLESKGTKEAIYLTALLYCVYSRECTCLIDDYSLHLHTNLAYTFLNFILKEDLKGQLLLTSHNTKLLSKDLFRQDEIYFMNKNKESKASLMYSLLEYEEDDDIESSYLQGKYNAVPHITNFVID